MPHRRIPGELTFGSNGLCLTIIGSLLADESAHRVDVGADDPTIITSIYDESYEGVLVTLLRAESTELLYEYIREPRINREIYMVKMALQGSHVSEDNFTEARVEFDSLTPG